MDSRDQPLSTWGSGDSPSNAVRRGDVVITSIPSSSPIVQLLKHLEVVGFAGSPRVVDEAGTGQLAVEYVAGGSAHPHAWADDQVMRIGELLKLLHQASASFDAPPTAAWESTWLHEIGSGTRVFGHGDPAPWNVLERDDRTMALIDWEFAGPIDPLTDLAYATWLNAQLHDDDVAALQQLPSALQRAAQARLIMDGYGVARSDRATVIDRMIEVAVHSARAEAQSAKVSPTTVDAVDVSGYPVLWAIAWRVRSASWMIRHRGLLESA